MSDERGFTLVETLVTLAVVGVIAGISVPMFGTTVGYFRLSGDARSLANAIAVAKIRAAADFTQVRLYVDLNGRSHRIETWDKTASQWTAEGGNTYLSTGVFFGYSVVTNAPPNSQGTIGQAPLCKNNAGNNIGNTACIIFNSRGVPVDSTGAPTPTDALYITDASSVYGVTISATGMARSWRANPQATTSWVSQ
jgi:prepilin-type N-terminal cleavage/methylation domain-containing protein